VGERTAFAVIDPYAYDAPEPEHEDVAD